MAALEAKGWPPLGRAAGAQPPGSFCCCIMPQQGQGSVMLRSLSEPRKLKARTL